jgi:ubiquitin-protein ligase/DNA-binding protein
MEDEDDISGFHEYVESGNDAKNNIKSICNENNDLWNTIKEQYSNDKKDNDKFSQKEVAKIIVNEIVMLKRYEPDIIIKIDNNDIFNLHVAINILNGTELKISLHHTMYPFYPPKIEIIKPMLKKNCRYGFSNLTMLQLDYWNPTRTLEHIILKLKELLSTYATIENKINKHSEIETLITDLLFNGRYVTNIIPYDNEQYPKVNFNNEGNKETLWKSGTGYGHSGCSDWDPITYHKACQERNKIMEQKLSQLNKELDKLKLPDIEIILDETPLIIFLTRYIEENMCEDDLSMYYVIDILSKIYVSETKKIIIEKKEGQTLDNVIQELYIIRNRFSKNKNIKYIPNSSQKNNVSYQQQLEEWKLREENIQEMSRYLYAKEEGKMLDTKRVTKELMLLARNLPINDESSIFVTYNPSNMSMLRAMIIGPKDTPYEHGCYIFSIYLPPNYPNEPPKVLLETTGGQTIRFNPNLYDNGKVCLSLLGTWEGHGGETWNANTSTLLQVLISIQSLILIPTPYFNEPSYEKLIGTKEGKEKSDMYNEDIRYENIKLAIIDHLENKNNGFDEIIRYHFQSKKEAIIKTCEVWLKECKEDNKIKFTEIIEKLKKLL